MHLRTERSKKDLRSLSDYAEIVSGVINHLESQGLDDGQITDVCSLVPTALEIGRIAEQWDYASKKKI